MKPAYPGADDILRTALPNGITVLSRANRNSASVVIHGYLLVGSLFDPDERLGLADFTASALLRGGSRHSFQEVYELLETAGASLRFSGGTHSTFFSGQALADDLDLLLDLLAELLRSPTFPAREVKRLKDLILTELSVHAQDTGYMAQRTLEQLIYAGHPYSRPEEGFPETVRRIGPKDLARFHQRHYGPRGLVIAVVGDVEPARVVERVSQVLGDWHNPAQVEPPDLPPVTPLEILTTRRVVLVGKYQVDLVIGAPGPLRRSPDFIPANLGNSILGQFGMMGRIGESVREKAGLAYSIQSNLSGGLGPGPWDISAGVDPQNVERAIDLIRAEVRRFISEPVLDEELHDCKAFFQGSLPLSLESNHGVASALINLERYRLDLDYYRNYAAMIQAISKEAILEAASRYLDPDRLGIAIAGPEGAG